MNSLPPFLEHRPYRVALRRDIVRDIVGLDLDPSQDPIPLPMAGQWVYLELPNEDGSVARAAFSVANASCEIEKTSRIELAIQCVGAFTTRACRLHEGDAVSLQGPFGVFTFDASAKKSYFFGGGIGVAPLRSMIREALLCGVDREIVLFLSCQQSGDIPYLDELSALSKQYPNFRFLPVCTREEEDSDWQGIRGRMTNDILDQAIQSYDDATCYVCGPKPFMDAITVLLAGKGVPMARIKSERFS
ncbi:MAG: FAD-dependent oxidoreductase [Patescibacteria group bacterium]